MAAPRSPYRSETAWRRVQRAADAHLESVRRAALSAFNRGRRKVDVAALMAAIESNDQREAERVLLPALAVIESAMRHSLPNAILATLIDGAEAALDRKGRVIGAAAASPTARALAAKKATSTKPKSPAEPPVATSMTFDRTDPEAVSWAEVESSRLIRQVGDKTRAAIRGIVAHGFTAGIPPRPLSHLIRSQIGLTDTMAAWVAKRHTKDLAAGIDAAKAAARSAKFSDSLIRRRALTIARTETITVSNEGQRRLWGQAQRRGLLKPTTQREWITTPSDRTCERCVAMDGQLTAIDAPFKSPEGSRVMGPTLHPECRCGVGIAPGSATAQPTAPGVTFKPTMSAAEAAEWLRGSALPDMLIHSTNSAADLLKAGVDFSRVTGQQHGAMYGTGFYTTNSEEIAGFYGRERVQIAIRVQKVFTIERDDMGQWLLDARKRYNRTPDVGDLSFEQWVARQLIDEGYDAVQVMNVEIAGGHHIVALKPGIAVVVQP